MSTVVGQRHVADTPKNKYLDTLTIAERLATHTIVCCRNEKIFLPENKEILTDKIVADAVAVITAIKEANAIEVKTVEEREERLALQRYAIRKLKGIPTLLSMAKKLNPSKFRGKKLAYWNALTKRVLEMATN